MTDVRVAEMMTASQTLWSRSGAPTVADAVDVPRSFCWVCAGTTTRGVLVERWMGSNFVGQNRVRMPSAQHVCEACVHVMAGRPPDTARMYSWLVDDRGVLRLNKGDKPRMREWLRSPKQGPWFAAIADSGKKHVIPWAPVNPAGTRLARVMFEEMEVTIPSDEAHGWGLVDSAANLLTAGATKAEISSGVYGVGAWARCEHEIRAFETEHGARRGAAWFELAVWLAQRDEAAVAERMEREKAELAEKKQAEKKRKEKPSDRRGNERKAAVRDRRSPARDQSGVPADAPRQRAEALGTNPGQNAVVGQDGVGAGGVGHPDGAVASVGSAQLNLFGGGLPLDKSRSRTRLRR